jgi:rubrerythrin
MTTTKKASKAGARRVTANLDALASLFQNHHASLGIPSKVAMDFAYRCDLLSDSIDRRKQAGYFNPAEIGEEEPGPLVFDENNPFMEGEFTQEEKRALGSMEDALAAEKVHQALYAKAKEAVAGGKDVEVGVVWVCGVGGFTGEGEPPEKCPVCGAVHTKLQKF